MSIACPVLCSQASRVLTHGPLGDGLIKYGRARCKVASVSLRWRAGRVHHHVLTAFRLPRTLVNACTTLQSPPVRHNTHGHPQQLTLFADAALAAVNEYKLFRKKMDSRRCVGLRLPRLWPCGDLWRGTKADDVGRLTLDSALTRLKSAKKDNPALEQEVEIAQQRL